MEVVHTTGSRKNINLWYGDYFTRHNILLTKTLLRRHKRQKSSYRKEKIKYMELEREWHLKGKKKPTETHIEVEGEMSKCEIALHCIV